MPGKFAARLPHPGEIHRSGSAKSKGPAIGRSLDQRCRIASAPPALRQPIPSSSPSTPRRFMQPNNFAEYAPFYAAGNTTKA
jgi:hypothetical protein